MQKLVQVVLQPAVRAGNDERCRALPVPAGRCQIGIGHRNRCHELLLGWDRDRLSRSEQQLPSRGAHMHRYLRFFLLTTMALGTGSNAQTPPPAIEGPVYVATYV